MRETTERYTVGDLAIEPVPCLPDDATLRDVAQALATSRAGTLVVASDPLTIVTERDLIGAVAEGRAPDDPVASVTTERPPIACEATPVAALLRAMVQYDVRSLVVVDARDRPLGIVTLASTLDTVLGGPSWLAALRLALHIEHTSP